jgi:hypothetical protein
MALFTLVLMSYRQVRIFYNEHERLTRPSNKVLNFVVNKIRYLSPYNQLKLSSFFPVYVLQLFLRGFRQCTLNVL